MADPTDPTGMTERSALAAEYALGTLEADESAHARALLATDGAFAVEVAYWQHRLSALNAAVPSITPSPDTLARILTRLDGGSLAAADDSRKVISLERRIRQWKLTALTTGALAAVLAAFVITGQVRNPQAFPPDGSFVAVLQADGKQPAFVAAVDLKTGFIAVRRVGAEPMPNKAYELWAVGGNRQKPQSLGVIDASNEIPLGKLGQLDAANLSNTVFAISEEPPGGSPTGAPTGPVVFTGKLISTKVK